MRDPVGQTIAGKYRVTRRLGGGGLAEVYEAVHEQIGQRFAIKILKREYAGYPEVSQRFLTEARAASAVGHPGIVQVFDIGELETGEPYLVMELLQGEDLSEVLQRKGKLRMEQAVGVCLHILDALDAAHRAGVVHRDLKPENVLLVRGPGGEPWAKVIDFGIARLAREGPAALRRTAQGTVMGTPYYISPEQARGVATIDGRADIYAVGVMLYEMLTGKLPYDGTSVTEIVTKVLSEPFPSPRAVEPNITPELERIILKATARNRDARYATAAEFADALHATRGEKVEVQIITEAEAEELAENTSIRRLRDLATAPRRKTGAPIAPPPPPPPAGRPSSPGSTPAPPPPPPPRVSRLAAPSSSIGTVTVPRRTLYALATIGAAVSALVVAVVLLFVVGRSPARPAKAPGNPRGPAAADALAVAQGPSSPAEAGSGASDPPDVPPAGAGPDAGPPDAGPPGPFVVVGPDGSGGGLRPVARVKLAGLPRFAAATVDGKPVSAEFQMEVSDEPHTLKVAARGYETLVRVFRVGGDLTIPISLQRRDTTPGGTVDAESVPPPRDAGPVVQPRDAAPRDAAPRDTAPQLLGSPFGEV